MESLEAILTVVGTGLEVLFLWKLVPHARHYPFFLAYVLPLVARSLITGHRYWFAIPDTMSYSLFYWTSQSVLAGLRLFVTWEVLRQFTPRGHPLNRVAKSASMTLLLGLAVLFWILGAEGDIFDDSQRKLSLAGGLWTALMLGLTAFYRIQLRREVFAMALGLGLFVAVSVVNTSALGMVAGFGTYWGPVRQGSVAMVMAIWLWGFWNPPQDQQSPGARPLDQTLSAWERRWRELRQTVRRILGQ